MLQTKGAILKTRFINIALTDALASGTALFAGDKNATNLQGGLKGWAEAGYPIETGLGITKLTGEE